MLIPYGTDASIYHWPFATVAMIAVNTAVAIGVWALSGGGWYIHVDEEGRTAWIIQEMILHYGNGLRPWQWVTSNFLHADILHLAGNMFCLWGFGLIVEGKVGWQRFLLIYFGIGVAQCSLEQTVMLFAEQGGSLGASSIIFGLLAICMIWVPRNEMNCLFLLGLRPILFDASLHTIAAVALLIQVGIGMLAGLAMSSQVLHLMGAVVGAVIGIVMLKKGMVDCDGWDLLNIWAGTEGRREQDEVDEQAAQALLESVHQSRLRGDRR